jgi:hypothetical protein
MEISHINIYGYMYCFLINNVMTKYDDLFERVMNQTFISSSINYENYNSRTDDELAKELKDLESQDSKTFRSDKSRKINDIKKEIASRKNKQ